MPVRLDEVASVAHQAAGQTEVAKLVDRGHRVANSQRSKLFTMGAEEAIGGDHEPIGPQLVQVIERAGEVAFNSGVQHVELQPEGVGRRLQVSIARRQWDWSG
jgi:nitrogen fixation/metabolism regulation signal transduction histidine kinase